ncbi:MAG: hypothetical protein JSR77_09605 [Planctomycetes bacterium]|nr:hypothetical protein [Planctomycetota bacterium]
MKNLFLKSALVLVALTCGQAMAAVEDAISTRGSNSVIQMPAGGHVGIYLTGRLTDTLWLRKGDRDYQLGTLQEYKNLARPGNVEYLGNGVYRIFFVFTFRQGPVPQDGDSLILRSADIRPGVRGPAIDWDRFDIR